MLLQRPSRIFCHQLAMAEPYLLRSLDPNFSIFEKKDGFNSFYGISSYTKKHRRILEQKKEQLRYAVVTGSKNSLKIGS